MASSFCLSPRREKSPEVEKEEPQMAKAERETAAGASAQMQVEFEDIAVSFSQEEWEYLDEGQKELYREVMKENYETLISLATGSPTFTPKIISYIERGEEPYIRGEPESEERESGKGSCSGDSSITLPIPPALTSASGPSTSPRTPASSKPTTSKPAQGDHQNQHEWKRVKNEEEEDPLEMEQIQTQAENVCENISQGTEKINTKNYKQESKNQRDPTEVSREGVRKCERNNRDLSYISEDQRRLPEGPFQIKNSDKVTSKFHHGKRKELQLHKRDHKNVKPSTSTECNKSFTRLSDLKSHVMIHTGDKPYTCTECNKSLTWVSNLKRHKMIHTGHKPYTCTECNKSFTWLSQLKSHQVSHTGYKPYTCTECNKSFLRLSSLKKHKMIHIRYKFYTCIEYNKSFTEHSSLKSHKMIHTGHKPYTCTECNKSFNDLSHLNRHKKIHTEYKPYTCAEYNKSFNDLSNLKIHKMIHTGDKPYTCTECNKSFTQLSHLKSHQVTHTGDNHIHVLSVIKDSLGSYLKRHQVIHTYTYTTCNKSFTLETKLPPSSTSVMAANKLPPT
uniref:Zinc finger protein 595-like isoform X4 n=1 Tax=Geotrypetes seraphini TaxID=260995 RepID=A0A6P8Q0F4_GEOSA|nr:zinc finger protein 595-like isoform X4 [Geotrypetes seraphini]